MSNFQGRFDLDRLLLSERERVRRFFHKWMVKLNGDDPKVRTKIAGLSVEVADLYVEFEKLLRSVDDATLKEMIEDAHRL